MDHLWTPWRYGYVAGDGKKELRRGVPAALSAWPGDRGCVFCNMLASVDYAVEQGMPRDDAEAAAYIVERSERSFLVLNAFPYNSGHLMAVPYQHAASLLEIEEAVAEELMRQTRRSERVLRGVYRPHGLNVGLNLGEAAGAGVADHLHMHVVPRWSGDTNFMTVLGETRVLPEELGETWKRLRAAFAADKG